MKVSQIYANGEKVSLTERKCGFRLRLRGFVAGVADVLPLLRLRDHVLNAASDFMNHRNAFTFRGVLAVIAILGVLLALLLPAILAARESARRNSCNCGFKQIGLAIHNFHDVNRRFPNLTSTSIRGVSPGSRSSDFAAGAGFSWQVRILPYMDQVSLYNACKISDEKSALDAFDPSITIPNGKGSSGPSHVSTVCVGGYICPSYTGSLFSNAPEYSHLTSFPTGSEQVGCCGGGSSAADTSSLTGGQRIGAAVSTFVATSATHLDLMLEDATVPEAKLPNGIIVPPPQSIGMSDITDGSSKTLMVTETREEGYSSWYDGTVGWVVMADPNGAAPVLDAESPFYTASGSSSLDVGPMNGESKQYLPQAMIPNFATDWSWGPSSFHDGLIMVGVADASARALSIDIDPTVLLRLTTHNGREPAIFPE